jgi:hypothetical protein
MAIELNITEVAKLTGLDAAILRGMRARETRTLKSGPPFCKTVDKLGNTRYVYKKHEVLKWLKRSHFAITGADAAAILGISRPELFAKYGHNTHSWKGPTGELIITIGKNLFIWRPKLCLERHKLKKSA